MREILKNSAALVAYQGNEKSSDESSEDEQTNERNRSPSTLNSRRRPITRSRSPEYRDQPGDAGRKRTRAPSTPPSKRYRSRSRSN